MTKIVRLLRKVDGNARELIEFLRMLVNRPSITGKEAVGQGLVADEMKSIGMKIDRWKPSPSDFKGFESFLPNEPDFSDRPILVGKIGKSGGGSPQFAFNGHIDVVPPGDERLWTHKPWQSIMEKGRIYGRGACDMKAGLAASIFALKALVQTDIEINKDLLVESVIGEEDGGIGTLSTILRGYTPDATVICEPTNLNLLISQCGCLMFRLRVKGKASHGAFRYLGVSALEKSMPILKDLLILENRRMRLRRNALYSSIPNAVALSIGRVRCGNWDSTVPEELVAEGRYGVWPGETLAHAKREFETTVNATASSDGWMKHHKPEIEWYGPQWESCELSKTHWLPTLISDSYREIFGERPRVGGEQAGTDMRLFTNVAMRPAILFGPGDIRVAHFRDEYVTIKDVIKACKTYALCAMRWEEMDS